MTKRVSDMNPSEYKLHRKKCNIYQLEYRKKNPETIKKIVAKYQPKYYHVLKKAAMDAYGSQCAYIDENGKQCSKNSEDDLIELTIDHSWGDGEQHRQEIFGDPYKAGWHFYLWLRNNDFPQDLGLQVLCKDHHSRPIKKGRFNDPIWLKYKYVDEGLSLSEISRECNCSYKTIGHRLDEFGIARR